jgi:hypothetical protein
MLQWTRALTFAGRATVLLLPIASCGGNEEPQETAAPGPTVVEGTVRFVALGDAGEGNEAQYAVAAAMQTVCESKGCDFALYLGDNFYNSGVDSVDDEQWQEKFELPYADIDFPFYAALGNHDYGNGGAGNVYEQVDPQIAYTEQSSKWFMPARSYRQDEQHVSLYAIDTNAILWDTVWEGAEEQGAWLDAEIADSPNLWRLAFGHHPYLSNGRHGNAGSYEGVEGVPVISGDTVKTFMESHLCGQIDVYFAGHDHTMQWLEPSCGTEWVVSGVGSKLTTLEDRGNPTYFESDANLGFLWVEIIDATLSATFYDETGTALYDTSVTKGD